MIIIFVQAFVNWLLQDVPSWSYAGDHRCQEGYLDDRAGWRFVSHSSMWLDQVVPKQANWLWKWFEFGWVWTHLNSGKKQGPEQLKKASGWSVLGWEKWTDQPTPADHRIDLEPPGSAEDGFDEAAAWDWNWKWWHDAVRKWLNWDKGIEKEEADFIRSVNILRILLSTTTDV